MAVAPPAPSWSTCAGALPGCGMLSGCPRRPWQRCILGTHLSRRGVPPQEARPTLPHSSSDRIGE
eukprot:7890673-Pyramimonas_sp.AAC.1